MAIRDDNGGKSGLTGIEWLGWIIAVVAILAAIYFAYRESRLTRELNESRGRMATLQVQADRAEHLQTLMDALTSPAAKRATMAEVRRPPQPAGQVNYLPASGSLVFLASDVRPLPAKKSYELWLVPTGGKAPVAAGLFRPDAQGNASVVLPQLPEGVEQRAFWVTVEDATGSPTPTLPIVMSGQ